MLRRVLARATFRRPPPVVAVVRLAGVIGQPGMFGGRVSLETAGPALQRAFRQPGLKAVALEINSPGGSPAQSALIHNRIRALSAERDVPVMAFVEDVAASGGYWLAAAADEIFVDDNSILGSIGVIYSGFGFHEALGKLGIERRLYTAGEKKSLLDPFLAVNPADLDRLHRIQEGIHDNFKELIRARRGARLAETDPDLFSGEFWLGRKAIGLGLADGIGDIRTVPARALRAEGGHAPHRPPARVAGAAPEAGPPARGRRRRGRLARRRAHRRDRGPPLVVALRTLNGSERFRTPPGALHRSHWRCRRASTSIQSRLPGGGRSATMGDGQ